MRKTTIAALAVMALAAAASGALAHTKSTHSVHRVSPRRVVVIPNYRRGYGELYSYEGANRPRCSYPVPFYFDNNCLGGGFEWGH